ncbi:hypothetical protein WJX84_004160 [Apatococcus fuscideae]|uniref:Protein-tyrosine-phosphatase n=1 Tax=Apatococcus fuscideae TaxID=2026836 RepID=A0AAW1STN0_9CHLO
MTYTEAAASAAARAFFYPSLLWNLARSRLQADWHWWDQITPTILLGALPFESMLAELSTQGVKAVVTLNEDFEVFISSDKYKELGFDHLHLPTVDFLFAPVLSDLHKGVDFIQGHCERDEQVYVHCKAGRGRSTTLVMCYLIRCCNMSPENALTHIRLRRPQVCLAPGQWAAILEFHASCQEQQLSQAAAQRGLSVGTPESESPPATQLEDSARDLSATLAGAMDQRCNGKHESMLKTEGAGACEAGCASNTPPDRAPRADAALSMQQATGYQQIDDWATLQPDGSMHDLPVSSLWSL